MDKEIKDYPKEALNEFETAVDALNDAGDDMHEGPLCDIANIVTKILDEYKAKGIDYIVDTYWKGWKTIQPEVSATFILCPHDPFHKDKRFTIPVNHKMLNRLKPWIGSEFSLEVLCGIAAPTKRKRTKTQTHKDTNAQRHKRTKTPFG